MSHTTMRDHCPSCALHLKECVLTMLVMASLNAHADPFKDFKRITTAAEPSKSHSDYTIPAIPLLDRRIDRFFCCAFPLYEEIRSNHEREWLLKY